MVKLKIILLSLGIIFCISGLYFFYFRSNDPKTEIQNRIEIIRKRLQKIPSSEGVSGIIGLNEWSEFLCDSCDVDITSRINLKKIYQARELSAQIMTIRRQFGNCKIQISNIQIVFETEKSANVSFDAVVQIQENSIVEAQMVQLTMKYNHGEWDIQKIKSTPVLNSTGA